MKFLFLIAVSLTSFSNAKAQEKVLFCTYRNLPAAEAWINEQQNTYDKFKHCALSCYLTLRCPAHEVRTVGILKEFRDLLGYGSPELADIKANFYGIRLAKKKIAIHDEDCARICDENYRP